MFSLFRRSHPRQLTAAMTRALVSGGLPPGLQASTLSVVLQHGSYSGRRVSHFRIFDPIRLAERGLQVQAFGDLDAHPDLVLGSGHVESDGAVVLSTRRDSRVTSTPARSEADRSAHIDDERIVFPTGTA